MLVVLTGLMLLVHVGVSGGGHAESLTCGSAWDVISGRVGWRDWWSADQASAASSAAFPRTLRCPGAVDMRMWLAAGIFVAALVVAVSGEFVGRRGERRIRPARVSPHRRRVLAEGCVVGGATLTLAGLVGIALLTADPHDPLFLYASRPVVVLIGLLLLSPAMLIVAVGLLARAAQADSAPEGHSE